jgi:uncharacterized protein YeaO (DUF488 family)
VDVVLAATLPSVSGVAADQVIVFERPRCLVRDNLALNIQIKRAYEKSLPADGIRILVDRLWPRGLSKKAADIDQWAKDIAPSTELRKWFAHDPARCNDFKRRYKAELRKQPEALEEIRRLARRNPVTLVYGARDQVHNEAIVLQDILTRK